MTPWSACSDPAPNTKSSLTGRPRSRLAIREAGPGDIVLIAGKGHEKVQDHATTARFPSTMWKWRGRALARAQDTTASCQCRGREESHEAATLDASPNFSRPRGEFDREAVAQGYSIDSRTIQPGELFFAVKGERMDGHDFVEQALEKGAVAAVIRKDQLATISA